MTDKHSSPGNDEACTHERLRFNSGDYYVSCCECHAMWMRKSRGSQPEYGHDHQGRKIGAAPEEANQGAGSALSDHLRTRVPAQGAWQSIETAPKDIDLLLGWQEFWPAPRWQCVSGLFGSTKGGWIHGQATHWMPLPPPPLPSTESGSKKP